MMLEMPDFTADELAVVNAQFERLHQQVRLRKLIDRPLEISVQHYWDSLKRALDTISKHPRVEEKESLNHQG